MHVPVHAATEGGTCTVYYVLCSVLYCTVLYPGATDGRPDQRGPRPHEVPARLSAGRKNI